MPLGGTFAIHLASLARELSRHDRLGPDREVGTDAEDECCDEEQATCLAHPGPGEDLPQQDRPDDEPQATKALSWALTA